MTTELYWLEGPWPGRLALSARPRGGDWLDDEAEVWCRAGIGAVLSLLTPREVEDLDLAAERAAVESRAMRFRSLPIPDRDVPPSKSDFDRVLRQLDADLAGGANALVHCRQGVGRTGLFAACLLIARGEDPAAAIRRVAQARHLPIPETPEQRRWIESFASEVSAAR